jgi:hypothetical protein
MSSAKPSKKSHTCSLCKEHGHNRVTCKRRPPVLTAEMDAAMKGLVQKHTHALLKEIADVRVQVLAKRAAAPPLPPPRVAPILQAMAKKASIVAPPPLPPPPKKSEEEKVLEEAQARLAKLKEEAEQKLHEERVRAKVAELLSSSITEELRISTRMAELAELF